MAFVYSIPTSMASLFEAYLLALFEQLKLYSTPSE